MKVAKRARVDKQSLRLFDKQSLRHSFKVVNRVLRRYIAIIFQIKILLVYFYLCDCKTGRVRNVAKVKNAKNCHTVIQIYTKVGPQNWVEAGDFRLHFCLLLMRYPVLFQISGCYTSSLSSRGHQG